GGDPGGGGDQPARLQKLFAAASRQAALRLRAEAASALQIAGASSVRSLAAGAILPLSGDKRFDGKYLITGVSHSYEHRGDRIGYSNTFTCIPAGLPFRSPQTTPRPDVGAQTAVVVGPPGETSFSDKYGRIKVRFHWDSEGASSHWVRVAQPAGGYFLPEVDDEVLVAFEHGDPDRPVVIGAVWNAQKPPPPQESPQND
ncbi:MAG: type VI secretion system tip protein VgrG, partial [Actinomycetota bacterium]|nr:type VI secretion system tip protein VgrG [Actinomycetota bacterium]